MALFLDQGHERIEQQLAGPLHSWVAGISDSGHLFPRNLESLARPQKTNTFPFLLSMQRSALFADCANAWACLILTTV